MKIVLLSALLVMSIWGQQDSIIQRLILERHELVLEGNKDLSTPDTGGIFGDTKRYNAGLERVRAINEINEEIDAIKAGKKYTERKLPKKEIVIKYTLSIMDLTGSGLDSSQVKMLTDNLLSGFVSANGTYKIVERDKRDEILKEQGFQQSGACDAASCLVEAGKLLSVQKIAGGSIGVLGTTYSIELRIIDVQTGVVDKVFSQQYKGDLSKMLTVMKEAAVSLSKD